jgi:hypothetical protein
VVRRLLISAVVLTLAGCAAAPTRIDSDPDSGFAIYRSGQLSAAELEELCRLGVEEMVVLDGGGAGRECHLRQRSCPGLVVRYDVEQSARRPVTEDFLAAFDDWVEEARREGRKIAFRCRHGWHRAGRLTAWYRMRFQQVAAAEAVAEMERVGRFMGRHPQLAPQVVAMADHLAGRPCSTAPEHCVSTGGPAVSFAEDACP